MTAKREEDEWENQMTLDVKNVKNLYSRFPAAAAIASMWNRLGKGNSRYIQVEGRGV